MISRALVIDQPWITLILDGKKTWEMRSTGTSIRGPIGLIQKGTGRVVGAAEIVGCEGPLDREARVAAAKYHQIPLQQVQSGAVDKWCYAWKLANVKRLATPISYVHPKGAVIWVTLGDEVAAQLDAIPQLHASPEAMPEQLQRPAQAESNPVSPSGTRSEHSKRDQPASETAGKALEVPVAKDGSVFSRGLGERGYFQVGAKGDEEKFDTFEAALNALRKMPTARWRRPNAKGNWGIVSAVKWTRLG